MPSTQSATSTLSSVFRMSERERVIAVGERITLSKFDLSEICLSYQNAAETISKGLVEYLKARGILAPDPPSIVVPAQIQVLGVPDPAPP